MESSVDTLGPQAATEAELEAGAERVLAQIDAQRGVQEAPTKPSEPIKIEREDLLEYKWLGSRAANAELQATMYSRELQRAQADASLIAHEGRQLLQKMEKKYNVDMTTHIVTEDGYLAPRPVADHLSQLRR